MRLRALAVLAAAALAGCYTWPHQRVDGLPDTAYYADLGPATIDVATYPPEQQARYRIFLRVCGDCHTAARAINSPTQSRTYWRFHLARMSLHARTGDGGPLPAAESAAILDFLDYDSRVRKIERRAEFERLTEELQRRFDPILERQLRLLDPGSLPPSEGGRGS